MKISGLQKLTLLDYPGKIASTIFTCGCNLKCPFCHNVELIENNADSPAIDETYVLDFLKERFGKLEGVAITGGEPLINDDIDDLIQKIKDIGYMVKLDTNGFFPDRLKRLLSKKLIDYVAMDIKSGRTNYDTVSGIKNYNNDKFNKEIYLDTIKIIINSDIDYEFRTTCVKGLHSIEDFYEIREMIKGAKKYFLQNYRANDKIEHLPFKAFTLEELTEFKKIVEPNVQHIEIRGM